MQLLLASTSPYRKRLLERLRIPFECRDPGVDEARLPGESPVSCAARLALAKAAAVAESHPDAWVIGSDQVAALGGECLDKPLSHPRATQQLRASSGQWVEFHTGIALVGAAQGFSRCEVANYRVLFRALDDAEIDAYLRAEQPYDCAGSFKCEGLGVALFDALEGADPTALEGLPLIATCRLLREAGINVLRPD